MANVTRYADNIIKRMREITNNKFEFTYEITSEGISFKSDDYFKFQSQGVKGDESGNSKDGYSYKGKMPPPSAFSKYTNDKSKQFAIAKSVQKKGIEAKDYMKKFDEDAVIKDNLELMYLEYVDEIMRKNINK